MAMALATSLISIRIAIPVALVEIVVGAVAGNIPGWLLAVFAVVTVVALAALPRLIRVLIRWAGHRVSEPEIKFLLVVLLALGGLATQAGSEALLPAYVAGLVVAGVFARDRVLLDRLRAIAFALLTPFFFLRAGTLISAPALASGAGVPAAPARARVHDAADGHGADVRLDRSVVRPDPRPHRRASVHRTRHR